jgi:spermidine synthase
MFALLFASGAAALVYEVCWSRQLGLLVGLGERGSALTLCAFFAGMTLGYALASPRSARLARPWRAYALCEILLAGWALALPWLMERCDGAHSALLGSLAILPGCVAMGASLPFALDGVARGAASVTRAYAFQLAGATLGTLLSTFVLIGRVGVWHSTYVAAAVSASCGLITLPLGSAPPAPGLSDDFPAMRWQLAAALAGAATLALEVLALRLFALSFQNSTYTFGLTVAVFITCLALGSRWLARRGAMTEARAQAVTSWAAFVAALGVLAAFPVFARVTSFGVLRAPTLGSYLVLAAGLVLVVLVLPVTAAGTLLPGLWLSAAGRAGRTVGALSAANGLGAAAGALLATYVLLPRVGLSAALVVVAALYAGLGFALSRERRRAVLGLLATLPLLVVTLRTSPPAPTGYTLVARFQTSSGWLDVARSNADRSLQALLDLHYRMASSADRARHLRMGKLPLALHGRPQRVLFEGLATGMTASAACSYPGVKTIEVVELIAEMPQLARHFAAYNGRLLDDPRVTVHIDDARAYLRRTSARHDVIVADLLVPWHSHAGYLYSLEHYQTVARRLEPAGVFAQWLPLAQLGSEELALIGDSFAAAFAQTAVWLDDSDPARPLLALVAGGHSSLGRLESARRLGLWRRSPGARLNSDEHPRVELVAPRTERTQHVVVGATLAAFLRAHVTSP